MSEGCLPSGGVDQPYRRTETWVANGDMVRVYNHRGEVRLPAK